MSVLRGASKAIRDRRIHLILLEYGDKVRAALRHETDDGEELQQTTRTTPERLRTKLTQIASAHRNVQSIPGRGAQRPRAWVRGV
jgi:hypothetical protein